MSRIRTIKPKFWDDPKLSRISRDARLLFIGMWTHADDLGVIIGELTYLKSKVFPYDDISLEEIDQWIIKLMQYGFIQMISHKEEIFFYIKNFNKHQKVDKPNLSELNLSKELLDIALQDKNINRESIGNQSQINKESIPVVREGKVREGKVMVVEGETKSEMTKEDFISFQSKLIQDSLFIEPLMSVKGIKDKLVLINWIKVFNVHIAAEEKIDKDYREYKKHFKNWFNYQDTSKPPPINNVVSIGSTIKPEKETDFDKYKRNVN